MCSYVRIVLYTKKLVTLFATRPSSTYHNIPQYSIEFNMCRNTAALLSRFCCLVFNASPISFLLNVCNVPLYYSLDCVSFHWQYICSSNIGSGSHCVHVYLNVCIFVRICGLFSNTNALTGLRLRGQLHDIFSFAEAYCSTVKSLSFTFILYVDFRN